MAETNFAVKIITPNRVFYEGESDFIEFTTSEGDIGVYRGHIPLTTILSPGAVTIHLGEGARVAAVHAGFAQILPDQVTLLAETAEWPDEIDVDRAEAARARAQERLKAHTEETDIKRAEFALRKALIRLDVAERG